MNNKDIADNNIADSNITNDNIINNDTINDTTKNNKAADSDMLQESSENLNKFDANRRYFTISIYALFVVLGSLLIFKVVVDFDNVVSLIGNCISILSPFFIGAFIAFLLSPLVNWFRNTLFLKACKIQSVKTATYLAIACSYIIAFGIIIILVIYIAPQIYSSLNELTALIPGWYDNFVKFLVTFEASHEELSFIDYETINKTVSNILPQLVNYITNLMSNLLPALYSASVALVKAFINLIIAIMVSVYMLSDHKTIFFNFKRLLYAILPKNVTDTTFEILHESSNIFGSFIIGKAIDSIIIGFICFFAMMIFRFPYAVLISVIVGITNMIPYFGPYIGGFIGGIIIIIVSPIKVIFFALLILVLQQFDGLYLGPKILGQSTGLKPLWVIFAITIGGSLFGIIGMFLGVPCVAVIAYILNRFINSKLRKKNITFNNSEQK